jgi:hypothetical protein
MSESNRREYYRIEYSGTEAPRFTTRESTFLLSNLSLGGLMYRTNGPSALKLGMILKGTITFEDGSLVAVEGPVTRVLQNRVAMKFQKNLPMPLILKEQKRLLEKE